MYNMKRGILSLSLFLIVVLFISGCAQMSPRITTKDTSKNNGPDCEEEYYPDGEPCRLGDLVCDGGWNVLDIVLWNNYACCGFEELNIWGVIGCQADMNLDQVIDGDDGAIIKQCVLQDNCEEYIESRFLPQD